MLAGLPFSVPCQKSGGVEAHTQGQELPPGRQHPGCHRIQGELRARNPITLSHFLELDALYLPQSQ